jgi:predicted RNase H-related nuclease YkuK (DUF458 family)
MHYILLSFLFLLTISCVKKPIHILTEKTVIRDTTIFIKSASIRDTINIKNDSIIFFESIREDSTKLLTQRIWYNNKINRLIAECVAKERYITLRDTIIKNETKLIFPTPSQPKPYNYFYWFILLLIIIITYTVYRIFY